MAAYSMDLRTRVLAGFVASVVQGIWSKRTWPPADLSATARNSSHSFAPPSTQLCPRPEPARDVGLCARGHGACLGRTRDAYSHSQETRAWIAPPGRQHAAARDRLPLVRSAANGVREMRDAQPDRKHQGPHGTAHHRACIRRWRLAAGDTIREATSGNTGISFAAVGRALGHPVTIFMPDWMSRERAELIASFGATIVPVSRAEGGFLGSIRLAQGASGLLGLYRLLDATSARRIMRHAEC
jgi:hypothetical protein